MGRLGFSPQEYQKSLYFDGNERPNVVESQKKYIEDYDMFQKNLAPMEAMPTTSILPWVLILKSLVIIRKNCLFSTMNPPYTQRKNLDLPGFFQEQASSVQRIRAD
jgi:hypothetical protein